MSLVTVGRGSGGFACHCPEQPKRYDQGRAEHDRGPRRDLALQLDFGQPFLQAFLEAVGALAGLGGVEAGVGAAGLLLQLEVFGAAVPVRYLHCQPSLDGIACFVEERLSGAADFVDVLGHDAGDGVALGGLLQFGADPGTFRAGQQDIVARFADGERSVVEIGGVVHVAGVAGGVELDVEHALGDDPPRAGAL